jgi:hypothetical protein
MNRHRQDPRCYSAISLIASSRRTIALVVTLLCIGVIAQGCFTYEGATKEELAQLKRDSRESISIGLTDGSSVHLDAYHYVWVDAPDTFMFGKGVIVDSATGESRDYAGRMPSVAPASTTEKVSSGWGRVERIKCREFRAVGGSIVRASDRDLVTVESDTTPTIWYNGSDDDLSRMTPADEITQVGVRRFSPFNTSMVIVGLGLAVVVGVLANEMAKIGNLDFELFPPSH